MSSVHLIGSLHQISGRFITGYEDAAAYALLNENNEALLIDIGSLESYNNVMSGLGTIGIKASQIKKVLPTHVHRDHVSGMAKLVQEDDCQFEFYVHPSEKHAAETGDYDLTAGFFYGLESPPIKTHREIENGQVIKWGSAVINAIYVPGHSTGSVLYRVEQPEGVVDIAGDALWGAYHPAFGSDVNDWVMSLDVMAQMPPADYITFGHEIAHLIKNPERHIEKARMMFNPRLLPGISEVTHDTRIDLWDQSRNPDLVTPQAA